jgi:acetyl-CoA synthetase
VLAAQIQQSVRSALGRHASPRIVDFVAELPKTETGKIRRNVLRDQHVSA